MFDSYDIEEIILGMADIVRENRSLRMENTRLLQVEENYKDSINRRFEESQQHSVNMLNAMLVASGSITDESELIKPIYEKK